MNKTLVVFAFIWAVAFADLATLTIPTTGVSDSKVGNMINGAADNDNFGANVCAVGLFNNDAYKDYAVTNAKGQVYVILGKSAARTAVIDLGDSAASSTSNFIKISSMNTALTATCASAGKWRSASRDSLVIGYPGVGSGKGEVYVIYPRDTDLNFNTGAGGTAWADSASTGVKMDLTTGGATTDKLGFAVGLAGDVTNDQFDDILISAPGKRTVYILPGIGASATAPTVPYDFGAAAGATNPTLAIVGLTADTDFGTSLDGNFDFNDDNIDDFIIGSPANNKVYICYGQNNAAWAALSMQGAAAGDLAKYTDIAITGTATGFRVGYAVAGAGDVDGDGVDDVLVGAPGYEPSSGSATDVGRVFVLFGTQKAAGVKVADITNIAAVTPTVVGQKGFIITGGISTGTLGLTLDGIGDVNEDGRNDFAVSAPSETRGSYSGKVYVVYGRSTASSTDIDLSVASGTGAFTSDLGITITGIQGSEFGASLAGVGDVTGDAIDDFVVGAPKSGSIGLASGVTARTANGIAYQFNGQKKTEANKSGFRLEASLIVIVSFFAALMF